MKARLLWIMLGVVAAGLLAAGAAFASASHKGATRDTLVVLSPVGVPSLERETFGTSTQQEVITNLMEPLIRFKALQTKDNQGALQDSATEFDPGVCVKWGMTKDGRHFKCTLGAHKSQYGNEITSADVKWTFDYMLAAKNVGLLLMGNTSINVKNPVTVTGRKTLTINLTQRNSIFMPTMTFFFFDPYDSVEAKKHATAKDPFARNWLAGHSDGFGPYMATSFDANKEVRMTANPGYAGPKPGIKNVVYRAVPDNGTRAQLLQSGTAHLAKSVDLGMYQALKSSKTVTTYNFPYNALVILFFNNKVKPFDDVRIRKAIACGIDKKAIVDKTFYGVFPTAHSIMTNKIPQTTPQYDECGAQNVAQSKQYLKDAGQPNLTVTLMYSKGNSGQDAEDNATLIQGQLAQAGIKVNLQEEPDATKFFVGAIQHSYGMFLFDVGSNVPDAGYHLSAWFGPGSVLNFDNVDSPKLAGLVNIIKAAPVGSKKRATAIQEYQKEVMSAQQVAPVANLVNQYLVNKSVCGLRADPGDFTFWQFLKFC